MIKLSGDNKDYFMEFLKDAYPELYKTLPLKVQFKWNDIELDVHSPLGEAWQVFDEMCG